MLPLWISLPVAIGVILGVAKALRQRPCPSCREQIDVDAIVCPNCNQSSALDALVKQAATSRISKGLGVTIVLCIAFVAWTSWPQEKGNESRPLPSSQRHSTSANPEYMKFGTDEQIDVLRNTGFLKRLNPDLNEAFVDPVLWNSIDFQTKEGACKSLAFYCGRTKSTQLNWVTVRDNMSGIELAKYSESWGFKVY